MKNKILATALLCATPVLALDMPCASNPFHGFYFGASAGPGLSKPSYPLVKTKSQSNANYGIYGGYGVNFSNLYAGLELGVNADTSKREQKVAFDTDAIGEFVADYAPEKYDAYKAAVTAGALSVNANPSYQLQRRIGASIAPRLGYSVANFLAFIKLGAEYSQYKIKQSLSADITDATSGAKLVASGSQNTKLNRVSFVPGVGAEYALGKFLGRVGYDYAHTSFGKKWNGVKNTDHRLLFGIGYKI